MADTPTPKLGRFPRFKRTLRGFSCGRFVDLYGMRCSLQASSLATKQAIWLGADEVQVDHVTGKTLSPRMHLDRAQARRLGTLLLAFADSGELPRARGEWEAK